jgi:hypothetical protein
MRSIVRRSVPASFASCRPLYPSRVGEHLPVKWATASGAVVVDDLAEVGDETGLDVIEPVGLLTDPAYFGGL